MRIGGTTRPYLRESLLALLVVALTFLNYGHVSIAVAGPFAVTADSWCGEPVLPGQVDHAPCHACRIGTGADLPPPPAGVEPVVFVAFAVGYAPSVVVRALPPHARSAQPRGPPALV